MTRIIACIGRLPHEQLGVKTLPTFKAALFEVVVLRLRHEPNMAEELCISIRSDGLVMKRHYFSSMLRGQRTIFPKKMPQFYGSVLPFFLFRIPMSCVFGFYSGQITWEFDANLVRERQLEEVIYSCLEVPNTYRCHLQILDSKYLDQRLIDVDCQTIFHSLHS